MFICLKLSQETNPGKRIQNLAPDHARNLIVELIRIRLAKERLPQSAAGHTLNGFDIQNTKEDAPVPEQRLRVSGGSRVVDLK